MPVVVLSYIWILYMPQLGRPVSGSFVNTIGKVMNLPSSPGCPSPGQHLMTGNLLRSGLSFSTTSWQGAFFTILGRYLENSKSLGSNESFSIKVLGGA